MGISTSTGTLVAGTSRTFDLAPASAITLTLPPNCRVTITESPATVAATSLGGNATRVHNPRLPGTFTYGPYPMGGSVLVENGSSSGSTVTWVRSDSIIAETVFSTRVALGIVGQSVEMGATVAADSLGVSRSVALSAPSQGIVEPTQYARSGNGSIFVAAAQKLVADGVRLELINGAVGGISFVYDACGMVVMTGRANSTAYRGKRTTLGTDDPGHRGEFIFVNGATWECTTGNKHLVYLNSDTPVTVNGVGYYSDPGYVVKETSLVSAGTPPTFPGSPALTNTVNDGSLVWTCIAVGAITTDATGIHTLRRTEIGFDPYYMLSRVLTGLMKATVPAGKRFVYIQNGQSDAGIASAAYQMALRQMGQYFGQSPYLITPIFGLTVYYPAQAQAGWDTLETVLSGSGLSGTPDYANSGLTTALVSGGYHLATPGEEITGFGFYYGTSLYRALGTDTASILEVGGPHPTLAGIDVLASALTPTLSKILRNSAT